MRGQGGGSGGGRRPKRSELVYPFNIAEYEATCPNGHPVELSTGYCSSAPSWWKQCGTCRVCRRSVERTVGVRGEQFLAGPIHWYGEKTEEEKNWVHDVLNVHRCDRCYLLAKKELAQALLEKIRATVEQFQMATLTEADIAGFLEELIA
ncbi:hypothetical protein COV28_01745 [candidate division WWE3 bacterium CG10_big_fil_rev_8_21_14_0_10_48_23]|nr:MAG: hypothetical protein COV28_01745 [candidate division WWE3 bacterium CG10_big_fil_rev_8_21_14_0_10_48_23]